MQKFTNNENRTHRLVVYYGIEVLPLYFSCPFHRIHWHLLKISKVSFKSFEPISTKIEKNSTKMYTYNSLFTYPKSWWHLIRLNCDFSNIYYVHTLIYKWGFGDHFGSFVICIFFVMVLLMKCHLNARWQF